MKVGIFICGLARSYKSTYQSFLNAFKDYDYDAYLHTWRLTEKSVKINTNSKELDAVITPNEKELVDLFGVKKILIEEQIADEIPNISHVRRHEPYPNNAICFHESVKRCFKLADNKSYDVCVVTRPDIFYHEKLPIRIPAKGTIVVPYLNNLYENKKIIEKFQKQHPGGVFDMLYNALAFGNYEDMQVFSQFPDEYENICQNPNYFLSGKVEYMPDRAFAIYVKLIKNIKIDEIHYKHGIYRNDFIQPYSW